MPRLYSPEWVAAFNEAVGGLDVAAADTSASLTASSGCFRVAQVVHDAPGGELTVTLAAEDGRLSIEVDRAAGGEAGGGAGGDLGGGAGGGAMPGRPDVTISLSYEDAAAMSRGQLDPVEAVGRGRVRVRGDLAVLVAGQALLATAGAHLAELQAATTY